MRKQEEEFLDDKVRALRQRAKDFQEECDLDINKKDNVLLSMPTGSGKTDRFLIWSINSLLRSTTAKKIIITAPLKALSNQRFKELYLEGYNVGIETGDLKYNVEDSTILCCTQEIATDKYTSSEYIVVIDEFHYIYADETRARTYIDFLIQSRSKNILICSATLGNLQDIKAYLDRISLRDFHVYNTDKRLTNLEYCDEIHLEDIKNAYVISFSQKECKRNARILRNFRRIKKHATIDEDKESTILKVATKYEITNNEIIVDALFGIAYYHGGMLPKEKLFVSELFEMKVIDTVFGTDAISLGVNFPIENIVFTTLRKNQKVIDRNLFDQIIGRAGRYGFFETGYIYYCLQFRKSGSLKEDFEQIKNENKEDVNIKILPSIKNILQGKRDIYGEVIYTRDNSTCDIDIATIGNKVIEDLDFIDNFDIEESFKQQLFFRKISPKKYKNIHMESISPEKVEYFNKHYAGLNNIHLERFRKLIVEFYDDEFTSFENCILLRDILCGFDVKTILKDLIQCSEREFKKNFIMLLQIRKYLNRLPDSYLYFIDLEELDNIISNIDATVFDIEFSFQEYSGFKEYSSNELIAMINSVGNENISRNKEKDEDDDYLDAIAEGISDGVNQSKKEVGFVYKKSKRDYYVPFKEGTVIYDKTVPGSYSYLVLLYDNREAILLNYSLYKNGFYSMMIESDLSKYEKKQRISYEEYQKALVDATKNSFAFYSSDGAQRKHFQRIGNILKFGNQSVKDW